MRLSSFHEGKQVLRTSHRGPHENVRRKNGAVHKFSLTFAAHHETTLAIALTPDSGAHELRFKVVTVAITERPPTHPHKDPLHGSLG